MRNAWASNRRALAASAMMLLAAAACGETTSIGALADGQGSDGVGSDVAGDVGSDVAGDVVVSTDAGADAAGTDAAGTDAGSTCPAATGERPQRRSEHAGAWDPVRKRLVIFGGSFALPQNCSFPIPTSEAETWIYDPKCDAWTQSKSKAPPSRGRHGMVYIPTLGKIVVMGGRRRDGSSGPYTLLSDMWAYDVAADSWEELSKGVGLPGRYNHAMVWAESIGKLVIIAGNLSSSGATYTATNDVYTYAFADGAWVKQSPTGTPPKKRFFAASLWDDKRKQAVIFGGADESLFQQTAKFMGDLWALDFSSDQPAWKLLDAGGNAGPDRRYWGAMTFDAGHDRYMLFGGHDDGNLGNRNDLWGYDATGGGWGTMIYGDVYNKPPKAACNFPPDFTTMTDGTPERRNGGAVTGSADGMWVHGGKTDCGVIDDLFFFDYASGEWQQRTSATVGEACVRKGGLSCNDYCF
jgi:hypothetical protein